MASSQAYNLFRRHRMQLACAVARQIQQTVPRYRKLDPLEIAKNVDSVLEAVQAVLAGSDQMAVVSTLDNLRRARLEQGFSEGDYLVAVLCTLPVIRRFYVNRASSIDVGLTYYEEVESLLIPLYGYWAANQSDDFEEDITVPDAASPLNRLTGEVRARSGTLVSYKIYTVEEVEGDELAEAFTAISKVGKQRPKA